MEISPVSMSQVLAGRDGRQYEVSGDAAAVVAEINALDDSLHVRFNEGGEYFVVYQTLSEAKLPDPDGPIEQVVLRVPMMEWDRRVVGYMQMRAHELRHGRSSNDRLDAEAAERKRREFDQLDEAVGELAPKMFRAIQKDLGINPTSYRPKPPPRA